ncbi:MAG: hypothetical protein AAB332_07750, partial [Planctomycetota bacterium]
MPQRSFLTKINQDNNEQHVVLLNYHIRSFLTRNYGVNNGEFFLIHSVYNLIHLDLRLKYFSIST